MGDERYVNPARVARMLAQAADYRRYLDELHVELVGLLGDPDPNFGHCFDAVWVGNWSARKLIERIAMARAEMVATPGGPLTKGTR